MAGEIKQKIVLEGEAEYNKALKEAQRELKRLRTELKAESAELDANGKSQDKAKAKQDSLKKQIAEQSKVVETLKKALAEAKESYGDNAEVVTKWENKLNEARTTLANMQKDLNDLGEGFKSVSSGTEMGVVATQSFADAISGIGNVGGTMADTLKGIFTNVVDMISEMVNKVWDSVYEVADTANSWADVAGFWGTSTAEIQKWSNAVESSHNKFSDFTAAIRRLSLGGKEKDIAEMLQIDKSTFQSDWEYGIACMQRLYDLNKEGQKMDDIYSTIFGERKAEGVMDLVNDWASIQEKLSMYDAENGGVGMTQEQLDDMSLMAEKMDTLNTTWNAFKQSFVAGAVGKIGLEVMDSAQGILDTFIEFWNADNDDSRNEALEEMTQQIEDFFGKLAEALSAGIAKLNEVAQSLKQSNDPTTKALGEVIEGITDAMRWMMDDGNWDTIKTAIEGFFAVFLVGKGAQAVAAVAELAANIKTISLFKGLGNLGSVGGGGIGPIASGLGKLTLGGAALTLTLATAAITIANAAINTDWNKVKEDNENLDKQAKENGYNSYSEQSAKTFANADADARKEASKDLWSVITTGKLPVTKDIEEAVENGVRAAFGEDQRDDTNLAWYTDRRTQEQKSFFSAEQAAAAQAWWDVFKQDPMSESSDGLWSDIEGLFVGQDRELEKLDALIESLQQALNGDGIDYSSVEDLPAWWFDPSQYNGPSSQDYTSMTTAVNGMPDKVAAAVRKGVSGITITLNGASVGQAVAPEVSRFIASYIV